MRQQCDDPFRRPASCGWIIDVPERLECERAIAAERMMFAAHGEHGGTGRIALVEEVDLRACIAAELHGDQ